MTVEHISPVSMGVHDVGVHLRAKAADYSQFPKVPPVRNMKSPNRNTSLFEAAHERMVGFRPVEHGPHHNGMPPPHETDRQHFDDTLDAPKSGRRLRISSLLSPGKESRRPARVGIRPVGRER